MKGLLPEVADRGLLSSLTRPGGYIDFESDLREIYATKRRMVSRFYGVGFMSETVDKGYENRMIFMPKNEGILIFC